MARAKVKVADADKASTSEASKVAADPAQKQHTTAEASAQGGAETPPPEDGTTDAPATAPAAR